MWNTVCYLNIYKSAICDIHCNKEKWIKFISKCYFDESNFKYNVLLRVCYNNFHDSKRANKLFVSLLIAPCVVI